MGRRRSPPAIRLRLGDFADFGSGDFADFGWGDFVDFGSGDFVDFGSGDFADFGSGSTSPELDYDTAKDLGRAAPRNLTACVLGSDGNCPGPQPPPNDPQYHRILLQWNPPTFGQVSTYRIERMRVNATEPDWVKIAGSPDFDALTNTLFIDEELPNGELFRYRVRAVFDDDVAGPWSNIEEETAVNDAPVAEPDPEVVGDPEYQTTINIQLSVDAPGVLENDADADSATLVDDAFVFRGRRAVLVTTEGQEEDEFGFFPTTEGGKVKLNPDGSFTYKPPEDFTGEDTFDYKSDSGPWVGDPDVPLSAFSDVVTVTITVVPPPIG